MLFFYNWCAFAPYNIIAERYADCNGISQKESRLFHVLRKSRVIYEVLIYPLLCFFTYSKTALLSSGIRQPTIYSPSWLETRITLPSITPFAVPNSILHASVTFILGYFLRFITFGSVSTVTL